ncbi:MAG: ABC transporter permease subunit/CPBP intramembrane protease [Planctomycetaceae bacterium]
MNPKNVKLIFLREIRDQLRDRRTVFMIAVLPVLLYPALGVGMLQIATTFREQQRTVVILGADHLPEFCKDCPPDENAAKRPPLLDGAHFAKEHFNRPQVAQQLLVFTDRGAAKDKPGDNALVRRLIDEREDIRKQIAQRKGRNPDDPELIEINRKLSRRMADAGIQVLVVVPEGFAKRLASRGTGKAPADAGIVVLRNSADEKSLIAYRRTREAVDHWRDAYGSNPIAVDVVEVAEKTQISATMWSKLFPALLVIMAVTGAFYPAVDLAAGEKERGTMETLLICPASRAEIVVGKFLTVMAFSMTTALLNLASMGLTGKFALSAIPGGPAAGISAPSFAAIGWVVLLLIPLAAMFSALSLAFATFARSSKEGQYYLTPLLMVTMGLTIYCLSPGLEIQPFNSIIPVMAPTLLLKELLSPVAGNNALLYVLPVLVTSFGYSALALWWAIDQFSREDILFRGAERFSPKLWLKHLLRDKEPTPSFAEAGFCFVLMMMIQFGAIGFVGDVLAATPDDEKPMLMVKLMIVQQLVVIVTPAVLMALFLTSNPRKTLRLNRPRWRYLAIAVALPLVIHPVVVELSAGLKWFFPKLPDGIAAQLATMQDPSQPLWFILLAFALAPAVCEEAAFRGFILSGFSRGNRVWLGIILSSALFGLIHMIPQQVFNAALVGVIIALLAVRSNSLLPGVVFHFLNNALVVVGGRLGPSAAEALDSAPASWFVALSGGQLRFEWPAVILGVVLAAALIRLLIPRTGDVRSRSEDGPPEGRGDDLIRPRGFVKSPGPGRGVGATDVTTNRAD